jgi:hypothetical protein
MLSSAAFYAFIPLLPISLLINYISFLVNYFLSISVLDEFKIVCWFRNFMEYFVYLLLIYGKLMVWLFLGFPRTSYGT